MRKKAEKMRKNVENLRRDRAVSTLCAENSKKKEWANLRAGRDGPAVRRLCAELRARSIDQGFATSVARHSPAPPNSPPRHRRRCRCGRCRRLRSASLKARKMDCWQAYGYGGVGQAAIPFSERHRTTLADFLKVGKRMFAPSIVRPQVGREGDQDPTKSTKTARNCRSFPFRRARLP